MFKEVPERESRDPQGKSEDGWKLLKEQLFRRWELLGICLMKMSDRRVGQSVFCPRNS